MVGRKRAGMAVFRKEAVFLKKLAEARLGEVHAMIRVCPRCPLARSRTRAVPGEGPARTGVMFIGEAPGAEEDLTGRPFVGMAGRFLNALLAHAGLNRKRIFITSIVKCRPPKNRLPRQLEISACAPYLARQLELTGARLVVLLGNAAIQNQLDRRFTATRVHGRSFARDGRTYFATYHPAAGMRFPKIGAQMETDFVALRKLAARK